MRRAVFVLFLAAVPALAEPPPGADLGSPLHQWFDAQHSIRGAWCCNVADGHLLDDTDWRSNGSAYEVRIAGRWWLIEDDKLRDPRGGPNPTGRAIVWYAGTETGLAIFCFAPGTLY